MYEQTRAMGRLHLTDNGTEHEKTKIDETLQHWVYEESFIGRGPYNTFYMHMVV